MPDVTGLMQACEPGPGGNWNEVNWNQVSWPVPGANGDTFASDGLVSDVNGAMSALETGDDIFAATGQVQVAGTLAATETGDDTFAAIGEVVVAGVLAATETGDDVFVSSGEAVETGVMYALETGVDTFASTGQVEISGTFYAQETGDDAFDATGDVVVAGVLAAQETGDDTFAAIGTVETPARRGGYGKDYKPKQREFDDELAARVQLREEIKRLVEPVKEDAAATVLAAQSSSPGVAVVSRQREVTIPVPPEFSAAQVARMVASELQRAEIAVRVHRERLALEQMVRDEQARIARVRRQEEELLLFG